MGVHGLRAKGRWGYTVVFVEPRILFPARSPVPQSPSGAISDLIKEMCMGEPFTHYDLLLPCAIRCTIRGENESHQVPHLQPFEGGYVLSMFITEYDCPSRLHLRGSAHIAPFPFVASVNLGLHTDTLKVSSLCRLVRSSIQLLFSIFGATTCSLNSSSRIELRTTRLETYSIEFANEAICLDGFRRG